MGGRPRHRLGTICVASIWNRQRMGYNYPVSIAIDSHSRSVGVGLAAVDGGVTCGMGHICPIEFIQVVLVPVDFDNRIKKLRYRESSSPSILFHQL